MSVPASGSVGLTTSWIILRHAAKNTSIQKMGRDISLASRSHTNPVPLIFTSDILVYSNALLACHADRLFSVFLPAYLLPTGSTVSASFNKCTNNRRNSRLVDLNFCPNKSAPRYLSRFLYIYDI